MIMDITFNSASFAKNEFLILKDIDLSLESGIHYAILGLMGSGKTTFLEATASKVFPKKGSISKPKDIELVPSDYSFHKFVGTAYQYYQQRYHAYDSEIGPTLYEVLQDQVKPIGTIDEKSVFLKDALYERDHLMQICKLFRIDHLLERKITSLSTGETRRSLLARSVLKNPSWLLLDSPFTGLDKESRVLIQDILSKIAKKGIGIILVCGIDDVPKFIDKIIVLKDGKIESISDSNMELNSLKLSMKKELNIDLIKKLRLGTFDEFEIAMKFHNANVIYGSKYALKDFSWTVKKGENWALMGPNGSGKSTVLSLVTADNPQAYRNDIILFDRKRGTGESIWDIKRKIGFVSAELQLYFPRNIKVWKLVASGLFDTAGLFKKLTQDQEETVNDYLSLLGISNISERPLSQLSAGEKRLAFLCRALVKNPPMLILDEPCQGLDYSQMVYFREILNEIVVSFNKTMVYVTHYEDEIPNCVNKRLDLSEGQVINLK